MENIPRLDKTKIAVFKLGQEPKSHVFWLTQTPVQRLEAVEFYRKQYTPNYGTESRLQRVYTITKRENS